MDGFNDRLRPQVLEGFRSLAQCRDAATWRDVAQELGTRGVINPRAPAELRLVRRTTENLVQAEQLVRVGSHKESGDRNWMALYKPVECMAGEELLQVATLTESMKAWALKRYQEEMSAQE